MPETELPVDEPQNPGADAQASAAHNNLAFSLMVAGRFLEARSEFELAIAEDPRNATALNNLGYVLTRLGDTAAAKELLERACTLDTVSAHPPTNLGNALFSEGQFDRATEQYEEAIRREPDHLPAGLGLAAALHRGGRLEEALRAYQDYLARMPADAAAHRHLGLVYLEMGRSDDAVRELTAANSLAPHNAEMCTDLGMAHFLTEQFEEAIRWFEAAKAADAACWPASYYLALALAARGKLLRAIGELEGLRERQPALDGVANSLAVLYVSAGLADQAVRLLTEVQAEHSDDPALHYNLGIAQYARGASAEAAQAFARAAALEPPGSARRRDAEGWLSRCTEVNHGAH